MEEIVKYDNILNKVSFREFTEKDFNLLMALCAKLKNFGEEKQEYTYKELIELIGWDKRQRIELFHQEIERMTDKLIKIGGTIHISEKEFVSFNLFTTFRGDREKQKLTVRVNPDFKYILNDLTDNFTTFELKEYTELNGRYPKQLYQHLKQFKKTGWWQVGIEEIRHELSIPDTYKNMHIMDKVIKPSIDAIKLCRGFKDLSVEVIQSDKRGRAITGYKFKWTPENQIQGQTHIYDFISEHTEQEQPATKKKKNKFTDIQQNEYDIEELEKKLLNTKE